MRVRFSCYGKRIGRNGLRIYTVHLCPRPLKSPRGPRTDALTLLRPTIHPYWPQSSSFYHIACKNTRKHPRTHAQPGQINAHTHAHTLWQGYDQEVLSVHCQHLIFHARVRDYSVAKRWRCSGRVKPNPRQCPTKAET